MSASAGNNNPLLAVDGLSIRRGNTHRVSWRADAGQHWVILGPNGSGKTSLLGALCGYLTPTTGAIRVFGHTHGRSDWRDLRTRFVTYQGLPSDHYLRLTDTATRMLRGEIPFRRQLPTPE